MSENPKVFFEKELLKLKTKGLYRSLKQIDDLKGLAISIGGKRLIDLSSNDYLGLSQDLRLIDASIKGIKAFGCGSRASRLMSGNIRTFYDLEKKICEFKGHETSLVFGSGYICNLSIISALLGPEDAIFMDRLSHASIVDGALLSRARIFRFNHNDISHLEKKLKEYRNKYKKALITTESVFSMDGDIAPIEELISLSKRYDCLFLLDEAHAIGVFGREGEGLVPRSTPEKPHIMIGTFGKALGSYGAFCTTTKTIRNFLINKARGLIYSTALPPSILFANIEALRIVKDLKEDRKRLLGISRDFRRFIQDELGQKTTGASQICPLILNNNKISLELEKYLFEKGFFAKAIRYPTVPKDSPRIRFSFTSKIGRETLEMLKEVLKEFFEGN